MNRWAAACVFAACLPLPTVAVASPKAAAEAVVRKQVAQGFIGAVVVKSGDETLVAKAFGRMMGVPVRLDSRFWISSTGKQFVSAALFKLQDERRLSIDDKLARWLPGVPAEKRAITLRQLLTHTSGLPQGYVGEEASDNETAVQTILAIKPEASPGEKFIYSNENFYLAAAIVERVAQKSYYRFVSEAFFSPMGMTQTGVARGPAGVLPTKGPTPKRLLEPHWGISGHYSSAPDLARWFQALQTGSALKAGSVQEMWKPAVKIGEGEAASGWFVTTTERKTTRIWTRGNDDYGANSLIYGYPERDIVIIVLTHAGDKPNGPSWSRAMATELEAALGL